MRANSRLFGRAVAVSALFLSGMTLATLAVTSAVGATGSNVSQVSLSATAVRPLSGVKVFGWGFDDPVAVASDGNHVWVANHYGNSVTELSASTGALVRVDPGRELRVRRPRRCRLRRHPCLGGEQLLSVGH